MPAINNVTGPNPLRKHESSQAGMSTGAGSWSCLAGIFGLKGLVFWRIEFSTEQGAHGLETV